MEFNNMEFNKYTIKELKNICKKQKIKGYSNKNKADIINLITKHNVKVDMDNVKVDNDNVKVDNDSVKVDNDSVKVDNVKVEKITSNVVLYHGDCLEKMKLIKDESIDMILCDLPYGMTKNKWDTVIPFESLWSHYNRIIKKNGAIILFGNQPFTSKLVCSNLKMFRYSLVWVKNKFSDFLNAKRKPMKTNEDLCVFYKKSPTYNIQYWYSTPYERWNTQKAVDKQTNYGSHKKNRVKSNGKRLPTTVLKFNRVERPKHPTQKPTDLLEWLIKAYTNENETVLDNCMGVGSTGVACVNTNRNFIGIELEKKYYDIAHEQLQNNINNKLC